MKIGFAFPNDKFAGHIEMARDFVQAGEELGYDYFVVYDHVLGAAHENRDPPLWGPYTEEDPFEEPLTFLSYMAAITKKLELATGVLVLPMRQTALVAKQCAQIAVMSGGRFRLGIGTGWNWVEYEAMNADFKSRGRLYEEQIDVLRKLWSEPLVDFEGAYHNINRANILPLPPKEIPVWFGAYTPVAVKRAARLGDGLMLGFMDGNIFQLAELFNNLLGENDRSAQHVGLEAAMRYSVGEDEWAQKLDAWRGLNGTHVNIVTGDVAADWDESKKADLKSVDQHIKALEHFKRFVDDTAT